MVDMSSLAIEILIVLVFIWRFARTRQLYQTSLKAHTLGLQPILFNLRNLHSFTQQILLGKRSIKPVSFFIRGFVLALVALCLIPFKDYNLFLFWLIVVLIAFYILWCVAHGVMLEKKTQ